MSRVLVFGDPHIPFQHPDFLPFLKKVKKQYRCDKVMCVGDIVDLHAFAQWDPNPDGMSPGQELTKASIILKEWVKAFPNLDICIGNHDARVYRKAMKYFLPRAVIKDFNQTFGTPDTWVWATSHMHDGVLYRHQVTSGKAAPLNACERQRVPTVFGHIHSGAGVAFSATHKDLLWGMNVGCGLDPKAYAFEYNKEDAYRPILGCGVVIDGKQPVFIPMEL